MEQKQVFCEKETSPANLSWADMVDLNIQFDYDAIIFPIEDDSNSTSVLHLTQPEDSTEIQGELVPSGALETPLSVETEQESSPSACSETFSSVEIQKESSPSADSRLINSSEIQNQRTKPKKHCNASASSQAPHSYHQSQHFEGRYQQAKWGNFPAPVYYVVSNAQDHKRKSRSFQATGKSEARQPQYYKSDKMPHHASAVTMIPPSMYIAQALKHINNLTQQVDDLKKELQGKIFDLHEEREQRIEFQVECKTQLEQIKELEKSLEHECHMRVKCEEKKEEQESFVAPQTTGVSKLPRIPKVTVDVSVLNELQFLKRQAEKNALNSEKLAKAFVEEQQLRVKYEDQLKSNTEHASRFKEQEETIKSLKSQVAELAELNLALKNEHHKVSSQTEASMQTDISSQTEAPRQTGFHRNRGVHTVRAPHHEHRTQNANRGHHSNPGIYIHAGHRPNPGLYPHAGHHPNAGLQANRRTPPCQ
ncbi:hypothetical protein ILYODFUR_035249 [Ilyodon furcidens]|uniref:Uncharacterized protein n=1 Tax=Ilyodon furcidens TaxID=33524 RepID=A0ABV0TPH2_9TELE